jgi:peptidyl-tRNA hydrolase
MTKTKQQNNEAGAQKVVANVSDKKELDSAVKNATRPKSTKQTLYMGSWDEFD